MMLRLVVSVFLALVLGLVLVIALLARGTTLPLVTGVIEREASEALNRRVTLKSPPYVKIGRDIEVRVAGLSVANAPWAGDEPLFALDEASVELAFSDLLGEPILIDRLRIDGVSLNLRQSDSGESNLPELASDDSEEPSEESEDTLLPILKTLELNDIAVRQRNDLDDTDQEFIIHSYITEAAEDLSLVLAGAGTFQGKEWELSGEHSGVDSLIAQEQLWGRLTGAYGTLQLKANYELPTLEHLRDMQARIAIEGTMPPRLAELSPVLSPDSPLSVNVVLSDVDPGVSLDAEIHVEDFDMLVQGEIDRPGEGDGLNLSVDLQAASLPRLAAALELGAADDVSLAIDGRVERDGRRIQVSDLLIEAGEHRITGSALIPEFPGTSNADFDLKAAGPEVAFYQRLLDLPSEAELPYEADVQLHRAADDREAVNAVVRVGGTRVTVDGALGDFPGYKDSDLRVNATSEDLSQIGRVLEVPIPALRLDAQAEVRVSEDGRATIKELRAVTAGAEALIVGSIDTYPDLSNLDARISLTAPSLRATAAALGTEGLGDVPVEFSTAIAGSVEELSLTQLALTAGPSTLASTTGALTVRLPDFETDLVLEAALENLPAIAGDLAPDDMPTTAIGFVLKPVVTDAGYALSLTDLEGPGLSGGIEFQIGRELLLDDKAHLSADIIIETPDTLIPPMPGYTPPTAPLELLADTRGTAGQIDATLRSGGEDLLILSLVRGGEGEARATLRGQGPDIKVLGTADALPAGSLPFRIDVTGDLKPGRVDVDIRDLLLGESELQGQIEFQRESGALTANLDVPRADLPTWLAASGEEPDTEQEHEPAPASSEQRDFVIPDTPLPLAVLEGPRVDVRLSTGSLGLRDPFHAEGLLIEKTTLHLLRDDGDATLEITELAGSRGILSGEIALNTVADGAAFSTDLRLDDFPIGITSGGATLAALPQHNVDANFQASGRTVRDLAASLDGALFLTGGAGTLEDMSVSFATESFLQQLLTTLLPVASKEDRDMQVECTVLAARAESGVVALDPGFVFRSKRVDLSARGTVDLARERLSVRFDNQARKGLGISAASVVNPFVQISGTLAKPSIGLDIKSSAVAGGAAVATGGMTVLAKPLVGRFLDRRNPCEVASERWEENAGA